MKPPAMAVSSKLSQDAATVFRDEWWPGQGSIMTKTFELLASFVGFWASVVKGMKQSRPTDKR